MWKRGKFFVFIILFQAAFLLLFALFGEYAHQAHPKATNASSSQAQKEMYQYYPMFQDVHVMMFIGFGFLMTFMKRYGLSSVGENMLLAAFVLQWATVLSGFLHLHHGKFQVGMDTLLYSDFAAASVLISMGALLGKASPLQYVVMAFLEIVVFQINEWIGLNHFKVADVGGSIFVHVFGAYFGIFCSRMLYKHEVEKAKAKQGSVYVSDHFSMIGTIFLWLFWPSFKSAVAADGDDQMRAVINTYFCLAACCVTAFAASSLLEKDEFLMEHIQNATLAGGVALGSVADMDVKLWGAILIGMVAAMVSVLGYKYLTPFLSSKLHLHDTCGVNNLHGMPGIIAALGSVVMSYLATEENYGASLYDIWPMRHADKGGRSAGMQAGYQAAALGVTIGMAIVGGCITGLILRIPIFDQLTAEQMFDDNDFWVMPEAPPALKDDIEKNGDVRMEEPIFRI